MNDLRLLSALLAAAWLLPAAPAAGAGPGDEAPVAVDSGVGAPAAAAGREQPGTDGNGDGPETSAPATGGGEAIDAGPLEDFLRETTTLRGEFRQLLIDDRGRVVSESAGVMAIRRPDRFRWEYAEPAPLLVLGDGERVWNYDVELESAQVMAQEAALAGSPAALLSGAGTLSEDFVVERRWTSDGVDWIELAPVARGDFRLVRLGFVGRALRLMELEDNLDQLTRIEFVALERNPGLEDELFVFTAPEGVDVIGADDVGAADDAP